MARSLKAVLHVGDRSVRVESYSGAEPFAEVVNEPGGLLPYAKKHLGPIRFADLEARIGIDADPALYQWIGDAWFGQPVREEVRLDAADPVQHTAETLLLSNAQLREVVLPALDVNAHDRRYLTVRLAPQSVRRYAAPGEPEELAPGRDLHGHAFTVEIDGIDCSGVEAVAPITVQTQMKSRRSSLLVFPDVHLEVAAAKSGSFHEWFEDFVIAGNNDDDKEREGRVTFYDPLLKDALATLELHHVGIYRVADGPRGRTQVDLYCERMELKNFV